MGLTRFTFAGNATWNSNPITSDWNTAANWTPQTVPNSTTDLATFDTSSVTDLSITNASVNLDSMVFNSGAPSYTLTIQIYNLIFYGAGIVNNSGKVQSIVAPTVDDNAVAIFFYNDSTAGKMTNFNSVGGAIAFFDNSSAAEASFDVTSGSLQADLSFNDNATAGDATINASNGSVLFFFDNSTGGHATLNLTSAAFVLIAGNNNAEHMTGNCIGGTEDANSAILFQGFSTAGAGNYTMTGGTTSGERGGVIEFDNTATAGHASFSVGGGLGAGLSGSVLVFTGVTNAGAASITAHGGIDGSEGGLVIFENKSKGDTASISLDGNATLDISVRHGPGVTIGSLAGEGFVELGANTLTLGANNLDTTFSGNIQNTGAVTKTGTGTLTLASANTYTGGTTVSQGTLVATNTTGSATGTGAVTVSNSTLGGSGLISGAIIVNSGGIIAPAHGTKKQTTLTTSSTLTFNTGASYNCTFKARRNQARNDQVAANGITINSGATFTLAGQVQGILRQGLTLTVLNNTSATPIVGAFSNLPDGGAITVGSTNFQASYEGGDGNDLTLTIIP